VDTIIDFIAYRCYYIYTLDSGLTLRGAMIRIDVARLTEVAANYSTGTPAGQSALLVTEGVELHEGLADLIPRPTSLHHLTSVNSRHVYVLVVRRYTVEEFVALATAYVNEDFDEATRLLDELGSAHKG
jgi:hypothetical protein